MSFIWSKDLIIDNVKTTVQIMFGEKYIGDKMYYKIGTNDYVWFRIDDLGTYDFNREIIIERGLELLKAKLNDKDVYNLDGGRFDWENY